MNMGQLSLTQDKSHEAHMDMNHEEETQCELCAEHSGEEVAITNSSSVSDVSVTSLPFIAFDSPYTIEYKRSVVPTLHLAATGPPVVPDIVRTIVLRT